jgi:hypothetical protein
MGGTDDPDNLIELSVEEHAEAHRVLWEKHGHWQDKVAWKGLAGLMTKEEILLEMYAARRGEGNHFYNMKHTEETKKLISEKRKGKATGPKDWSADGKQRIGEAARKRNTGKTPWNKGKKNSQPKRTADQMASFSISVVYEGIEYPSIAAAARAVGISEYKLKKSLS